MLRGRSPVESPAMPDSVPPQKRSRIMASIRGRDTTPELYVRKTLWNYGFRYRLCTRQLPGSPDLVLKRYSVAVFVHGCFWHQHGCPRTHRPSSNRQYWDRKLDGNIARDIRNQARLLELGWRVFIVWECSLPSDTEELLHHLCSLRDQLSA